MTDSQDGGVEQDGDTCAGGRKRYFSLRDAVALDYIKDGMRHWNELDWEERHGSLEMARWALEDATTDDLERHLFNDDSVKARWENQHD